MHTETCKRCGDWFALGAGTPESRSPDNSTLCVHCHDVTTDPLRFHNFAAVSVNESHDPDDWTHGEAS